MPQFAIILRIIKTRKSNFLFICSFSTQVCEERSTTAGSKSIRDSFSLSSSMKKNICSKNVDQDKKKNKFMKEISFFKNTLNDYKSCSNRPIAYSNNKEIKVNTSEYFRFSPTKVKEKYLVNASYLKIIRENQHVNGDLNGKFCSKRNNNMLYQPEKENSFDNFMKDFKVNKNVKNQFAAKYMISKN